MYLAYAIAVRAGILWANAALLVLSVIYFIFYLVTYSRSGKQAARVKRAAAGTVKWSKLAIKAFTLGVSVWGVYIAMEHFTPISALLMTSSALGWVFGVVLELAIRYAESKFQLIMEGVETDVKNIAKPVTSTVNFVRRVTGKEVEDKTPSEPSKKRLLLDKLVDAERKKREQKKEEERVKKQEEAKQRKSRRAEERARQRQIAVEKIASKFRIKKSSKPSTAPAALTDGKEHSAEDSKERETATK